MTTWKDALREDVATAWQAHDLADLFHFSLLRIEGTPRIIISIAKLMQDLLEAHAHALSVNAELAIEAGTQPSQDPEGGAAA